jgi:hypothetical protein
MSVLETPRLIFRGQSTWDPIVTNNLPQQYGEADGKTVFGSTAATVAAFRKDAIDAVLNGNWNPQGTHRSTFYATSIVGVDTGDGPSSSDPIVNCPVSFTGMLVDLEPYGAYSSQLYFDAMSFGIQGGCRVFAPRTTRMTGRYINFGRNTTYNGQANPNVPAGGASVVWQTSFPKANGLRIDAHDSPALQELAKALQDDEVLGLTVRWNSYRTLYFDSLEPNNIPALAQQLHDNMVGGGFQPNPARSEVVGVLGLWRKGEPATEPGDRALLTQQATMASAHVRLSQNQLTLDLANSVPETDIDLTKMKLGDLTAVAVAADGTTVIATLGTFGYDAYDKEAYEASAGIVTIKVDPVASQQAQTADIQLRRQQDGSVLLAETALRAVPTMPNIYLDEGNKTTLPVQVLDRGKPAAAGITVTMTNPDSATAASVTGQTDAQGIVTFPISGTTGEIEGFVLTPGQGAPAPQQIDPQSTTYVYVRTLPADANIAALEPTWDNVQHYVLRNWQAMAPCMDNWLDLGNPDQVKSFAPMLHKLTAKESFEAFRFMPVTRDMTAGQRTLLYAFLDGTRPLALAAKAPPRPSLRQLSRAMRGG